MTINTNIAIIDLRQNALCSFGTKKKASRLCNTLMTNWEAANKVIPIWEEGDFLSIDPVLAANQWDSPSMLALFDPLIWSPSQRSRWRKIITFRGEMQTVLTDFRVRQHKKNGKSCLRLKIWPLGAVKRRHLWEAINMMNLQSKK